jgi:hypothetical protein
MVRNAAIAAGNSGRMELIPVLERLREDDDPVVAEAAEWALARLARANVQSHSYKTAPEPAPTPGR